MLQGNVDHAESLWIEATINKHPVVFGVVYRKPNTNLMEFQNTLIGVLEKFKIDKKQCILMGDFNINIHADNNDHEAFLTTLFLHWPTSNYRKRYKNNKHIFIFDRSCLYK